MFRLIPILATALLLVGCAPTRAPEPEKTQLEVREFQTRTFEVGDYTLVMKSIINVLQDDGYMVKNASSELGFVSASKDVGLDSPHWAARDAGVSLQLASNVGFGFGFGARHRFPQMREPRSSHPTHQSIESTVNVSQFGEKVRVRASFQSKIYDNNEAVVRVQQVANEQFYQDFFSKVDKGIFLQQQDI